MQMSLGPVMSMYPTAALLLEELGRNKDLTNVISQAFRYIDPGDQWIWEMVSQGNCSIFLPLVEYQKEICFVEPTVFCLSLGSQILLQDICGEEA